MAGGEQPQAFEAFVVAATPRLRRTARLLTCDPVLGEDLMQTVLLKVFIHWRRVQSSGSPLAYTQRVMYTTYYAWSARRWNREIPVGGLPDTPAPDSFDSANTGSAHAALMALPRRQRVVLVARYYDDLTVDQTAELLGCSPSNVKKLTAQGLQRLRAAVPERSPLVEEQ
jgi:RNA polymerase sigma-70 factor (sigma-E family)